ncbi:uncharacterized protein LOC130774455 isoform X3 [Actinidia eriantha]|uniref:uncharacterized protein LOC130774455 isoform X3 n=1 Tax=Actinidia eriantha TaxID=165200 RepID=UPI002586262D|nr:uncharacterized protein LOC130774455 isoform X3 [Actinidia eriantha]
MRDLNKKNKNKKENRIRRHMNALSSLSPALELGCGSSGIASRPGYAYGSCNCACYSSTIVAKKSKNSHPPSPQGAEPAPPRITSNVRQNLRLLKLWKELQKRKAGTPKPATGYRRKKVEKEDLPEDTETYRDPTSTLYYTNQGIDTAVPVLLVDGYNVCGQWAKLKKHFMSGRLDIARLKLLDELVAFSLLREVKVVVVFDAMMSGLPTNKEDFAGVDVVFSGETCADAWIEKEGAVVWSCKALVSEIKAARKEEEMMIQEQSSSSMQGKLLKHNLDPEVVDALKDLRNKLSANGSK